MNRGKSLLCMMLAIGCALAFNSTASAHKVFKDKLSAKYPNLKVSCNACHVKGEKKSVRNNYGKLFFKTFENKKLTAEMPKDRDEKKEYTEKVMAPEFEKAFEKIKAMTFADLMEAGVIDGITKPEGED
ncbi:MAG: hypothetical protein AB8B55_20775 [Mariniblastus sp.]